MSRVMTRVHVTRVTRCHDQTENCDGDAMSVRRSLSIDEFLVQYEVYADINLNLISFMTE